MSFRRRISADRQGKGEEGEKEEGREREVRREVNFWMWQKTNIYVMCQC